MLIHEKWVKEDQQGLDSPILSQASTAEWQCDLLTHLYYSNCPKKLITEIMTFNDVDLASHILQMTLRNWQDQNELNSMPVPQCV